MFAAIRKYPKGVVKIAPVATIKGAKAGNAILNEIV